MKAKKDEQLKACEEAISKMDKSFTSAEKAGFRHGWDKREEFDRKRREDGVDVLIVLKRIQAAHPMLRVGQIIANAMTAAAGQNYDVFYIENDKLLAALVELEKKLA
ncbi:MAG: hypothetical protein ACYDHY_06570 [Acidiferrobacterales bacterium]